MEFAFSRKEFEFSGAAFIRRDVAGLSLVEITYSPNTEISAHVHEQANFCMAIAGGCTEIFAAKMREYKPFTLDFLPAFQTHSIRTSSVGMRAFSIDVSSHWLKRMREYSLSVEESVYCAGGVLTELLIKLYREFQNLDEVSPLSVEGLMLEMLAGVSRHQAAKKENNSPRWLKRAEEIVSEQFSSSLSLETIAREVGIHPVHLARVFHRHYRCTIGEFIRRVRIENACRNLITGETPLIEIASLTGFSDQSHFNRTFKRLKGMTPAEYRIKFGAR